MRRLRRLTLSLTFLACVLGSALASGTAAAQGPPDPQTTNIPYLAWRGEEIRLVKCDPSLSEATKFDWIVEEWTGSGPKPQVETSTIAGFENCAVADVVSLDPGLARIQLVASNASSEPILKHQFLAIWMTLNDPSIDEVGSADPTGDTRLGDPPGDGIFTAGDSNGRIQVKVTGSFPHPQGPGGSFTLPTAWPDLAAKLADDSDSNPDNNAARWDIHDDLTKYSPHVLGYCTTQTDPTTTQDAVDNCNAGSNSGGPFSRVFGDSSGTNTFGPFDPLVLSTLLSDGRLNADDAPMPSTRVDFEIAKNTGGSDIGGVGSLEPADKAQVYSRNTLGNPIAHNYYAPFYGTYIPATSRPGISSGIDGPAQGNNFRGFLVDGFYSYWQFADVLRTEIARPTTCLRRKDQEPVYRLTPAGAQRVAVYTDEHGEAQVEYNPGTGAYYDALAGIRNANGGCDLEDVDLLGTSHITATARYPYKAVSADPTTASIDKEVHSLFTKFLRVYPKGLGTENDNSRIVVAQAIDVDGRPFADERVCFNVSYLADGVFPFFGTVAPGVTIGGTAAPGKGTADSCSYTDANGRAAVEVLSSSKSLVNVIADFDPEGLLRSTNADFRTPAPPGGTPKATTPPTKTDLAKNPISVTKATPGKTVVKSDRIWIASARLVKKGKKVSLVVRINSDFASHARLRAKVLGKHHRKLGTWTKSVRTNHKVILRVNRKARAARVSLAR